MAECLVCGERAGGSIGGCMLCRLHTAAFTDWSAAERAAGRSVDVARWALKERGVVATNIRISPAAMRAADALAEARGLSRNKLIETLILAEADRPKK